jgi:hypothetical protein
VEELLAVADQPQWTLQGLSAENGVNELPSLQHLPLTGTSHFPLELARSYRNMSKCKFTNFLMTRTN